MACLISMNKEREEFITDSYSELEKVCTNFLEDANTLPKVFPDAVTEIIKNTAAEYFALRREMAIVSEYTDQREAELKLIFQTANKLNLDEKPDSQCIAACIFTVDAQLTIAYGLSQDRTDSDPVLQFAKELIIRFYPLSLQIAHLPFRQEVFRRYTDEEKAEKFLAAYFAFLSFFKPFRNDYQRKKTMEKFFYATGYSRRPGKKNDSTKELRSKFKKHYKRFNELKKFKKNQKKNDTEIIRMVCAELEKKEDKKTVYRVRSGINTVRRHRNKL